MPGQVKRREVYEDDFFGPLGTSAKEAKDEVRGLTEELIEAADVLEKKLNKAIFNNVKNINDFLSLTKKANKMKRESVELDRLHTTAMKQQAQAEIASHRVKQAKLKTEAQEIRNSQLLERQKRVQANAEARAAKIAAEESDAYKILSKRTREQKNESKRLAVEMRNLSAEGKRNTKEYREVASQYRNVTREAQKGDRVLKQIDSTVGDNFRNVGNYSKGLDKLRSSFTRIAGALGLFTAVRGMTGIVVDFDQAQGDLLAISGKTADEMANLTKQAKDLGATTQFSATQITEMQIELAKLGFTTSQIEQSTAAVSNFAAATGAEIPEAAALAGASLRSFGLDADQMDRVVSTLGVATTKTALDFNFLQTAMSTVAPVAKAFGFSIEDTTGLLGQLANSGFDASSAATATRNILLNLADSSGALSKELQKPIEDIDGFAKKMGISVEEAKKLEASFKNPVKSAEDLAVRLQVLQHRGIDLASALELTDKRSVAAFQTFIDGSGSLKDLVKDITDVNKELEDMAEKRLDTIAGQFTLLQSAWEGWVLSVNEGSGAGESIKSLISFLANNLPQVISVVGQLIKLFLVYKTRIIALNAAQKIFNDGSGKISLNMKTLVSNFKDGIKSGKGFGGMLKGIGWTLAISLALEFATALYKVASGAEQAEEFIRRYNNAQTKGAENGQKRIDKYNKSLQDQINKVNLLASTNEISDEEAAARIKELTELRKKQLEQDIKAVKDRKIAALDEIKSAREARKKYFDSIGGETMARSTSFAGDWGLSPGASFVTANVEAYDEAVTKAGEKVSGTTAKLNLYRAELEAINQNLVDQEVNINETTKAFKLNTEKVKENNTEFKKQIDLMKELISETRTQLELMDQLRESRSSEQVAEVQELIDAEIQLQKIRIETEGKFQLDEIKSLIDARQQLEIDAIIARRDFEISTLKSNSAERFAQMRSDLEEERATLLEQDKLTASERAKIEQNYQSELEKIRLIEEANQITIDENIVVLKENANNEILELERQKSDEIHDINVELNSQLADLIEQQKNREIKAEEDKLAKLADIAKRRRELAKAFGDFLDKESDKRIAKIKEEQEARRDQIEHYEALAESGRIKTDQAIKEQERRIAELEKQRIAEERAKQRRQLISTTYDIYQSKVEAGSDQPLNETIKDISLLQAFISTIPAFEKGIENTGPNGFGIDGRGGFLSMLHPYERVVDAENNSIIPDGMTNSDLAQIANDYDRGILMHRAEMNAKNGSNWETLALMSKMDQLISSYDSTPDFAARMEQLSDEVFLFITEYIKVGSINEKVRRFQA